MPIRQPHDASAPCRHAGGLNAILHQPNRCDDRTTKAHHYSWRCTPPPRSNLPAGIFAAQSRNIRVHHPIHTPDGIVSCDDPISRVQRNETPVRMNQIQVTSSSPGSRLTSCANISLTAKRDARENRSPTHDRARPLAGNHTRPLASARCARNVSPGDPTSWLQRNETPVRICRRPPDPPNRTHPLG